MHRLIERSLWSLPREETEEKIDRRGDGEIGMSSKSAAFPNIRCDEGNCANITPIRDYPDVPFFPRLISR